MNSSNKDRILNIVFLGLVGLGVVVLAAEISQLNLSQFRGVVAKVLPVLSVVFGLIIKLVNWLSNERDKISQTIELSLKIAQENRIEILSLKEDIRDIKANVEGIREKVFTETTSLDRRFVQFEARMGVSQKLETLQVQLNETTTRLEKSLHSLAEQIEDKEKEK